MQLFCCAFLAAGLTGWLRAGAGSCRGESASLADHVESWHDGFGGELYRPVETTVAKTEDQPAGTSAGQGIVPIRHYSRKRLAVAFGVAAVSDFLAMWTEFAPPIQWALDLATAGLLFLILGRRWALLPGLVVEAIPGMGVFPVWILVVLSLILYDEIKSHRIRR